MTSYTKQLVDQEPANEWVSTAKLIARCAELEADNARMRSALGEVDHVLDTQIPARAKPQPPPIVKSRAQTLKVIAQRISDLEQYASVVDTAQRRAAAEDVTWDVVTDELTGMKRPLRIVVRISEKRWAIARLSPDRRHPQTRTSRALADRDLVYELEAVVPYSRDGMPTDKTKFQDPYGAVVAIRDERHHRQRMQLVETTQILLQALTSDMLPVRLWDVMPRSEQAVSDALLGHVQIRAGLPGAGTVVSFQDVKGYAKVRENWRELYRKTRRGECLTGDTVMCGVGGVIKEIPVGWLKVDGVLLVKERYEAAPDGKLRVAGLEPAAQ
jgi:hypothetical protein